MLRSRLDKEGRYARLCFFSIIGIGKLAMDLIDITD